MGLALRFGCPRACPPGLGCAHDSAIRGRPDRSRRDGAAQRAHRADVGEPRARGDLRCRGRARRWQERSGGAHRHRALPRAHVVQGHQGARHDRLRQGAGAPRGDRAAVRRAVVGGHRRGASVAAKEDRCRGAEGRQARDSQRARSSARRDRWHAGQRVHVQRRHRVLQPLPRQSAGDLAGHLRPSVRRPGLPAVPVRARGGLRGEEPVDGRVHGARIRGVHALVLCGPSLRRAAGARDGGAPQAALAFRDARILRALLRAQQHGARAVRGFRGGHDRADGRGEVLGVEARRRSRSEAARGGQVRRAQGGDRAAHPDPGGGARVSHPAAGARGLRGAADRTARAAKTTTGRAPSIGSSTTASCCWPGSSRSSSTTRTAPWCCTPRG